MTALTEAEKAASLGLVPLFSRCSKEETDDIAQCLEPVAFARDHVIFHQGEPGQDMFIVAQGHVRIVSDIETEKVVFSHLTPGDFFGEMALLSGEPRSAGAIATTDCVLWRLSRDRFLELMQAHPAINEEVARVLSQRVSRGNAYRFHNEAVPLLTLTSERDELTIGRWPQNDLQLPDPQVDGVHAKITRRGDRWFITDQNSTTGTYVNRQRVQTAELRDGDEVLIGTNRVFLDGLDVKSFATAHGVRIDAIGLNRTAGGKLILDDISLSIIPGEFVALVGGSGAGKTSLLHALNGFSPATDGKVHFDGVDLYENIALFRPAIGYLPQDDIVHPQLSVQRTLFYAARLRLPGDLRRAEVVQRIEEVLQKVDLTDHRHTPVSLLSGGQRKRLSLAVELLATPRALFLDEPTSGLDPSLDSRMMALFRDLTMDGVSVVMSTHNTQNLRMCDKLVWLSQGRLVFFGSPAECLRHFHVSTFGEVYDVLNEDGATDEWASSFRDSLVYKKNVLERRPEPIEAEAAASAMPNAAARAGLPLLASLRQLFWLTLRFGEITARDVRYTALLLMQAPVIAGFLLLIFKKSIFALPVDEGGDALLATAALKAMMIVAIWLGAFNAARSISGETAIYARERLVNLGILPYVGSKLAVLSVLCAVQAAVLVGMISLRIDFPGLGSDVYPSLFLATFLTALGGLTMGLLVSSTAHNTDQAMAIVPMLLIPQLIFDGSFVPIEKMLAPAKLLANAVLSRWSLELAGNITDLADRYAAQLPAPFAAPFQEAFTITPWVHWSILMAFIVAPLLVTLLVQKRKDYARMR